ncbi:hypothetical protein BA177_07080 [Woeseia oceani]|uniref:Dipeptidylpeptidase IV N-terminal domain-containing protein n=2 Tax=Woeseia oceani TaxID=1548547 RepID=A0A193LF46_9GAMM|nr:hypothetical protein BA177_07080 [Woeseia oceani]
MAQQTLLLEDPDISATQLAFVYAGDIWVSQRDGSQPRRLTSDPASEYGPVFSPDGTKIEYGSGYSGLFRGSSGWKGYRGGTTPAIQIMDLARDTVTTVDGANGTKFNSIWLGEERHLLSDRDQGQFNVYHYNQATTGSAYFNRLFLPSSIKTP